MKNEFIKIFIEYVKKDPTIAVALLFAVVGVYLLTYDSDRQVIAGIIVVALSTLLTALRIKKNYHKAKSCLPKKK